MKNIRTIALLVVLTIVFIFFRGLHHHKKAKRQDMANLFAASNAVFEAKLVSFSLEPKTLEVVEVEEGINLGFDTAHYLPEGFGPYSH